MRIGISGASGKLGRSIVERLRELGGGHEIVAITRTPAQADGIDYRRGDYDRPDELAAAYAGLDRLLIIPSADLQPGVRSRQGLAAIDAADRAGVGVFFLLSACGSRRREDPAMGAAYG